MDETPNVSKKCNGCMETRGAAGMSVDCGGRFINRMTCAYIHHSGKSVEWGLGLPWVGNSRVALSETHGSIPVTCRVVSCFIPFFFPMFFLLAALLGISQRSIGMRMIMTWHGHGHDVARTWLCRGTDGLNEEPKCLSARAAVCDRTSDFAHSRQEVP